MRYFEIYADANDPQPRFLNWHKTIKTGRWQDEDVYESLSKKNHFQVEYSKDAVCLDVLLHPGFMVSKEFMAFIHQYDRSIPFKTNLLFDPKTKRSYLYQMPQLPVDACLSDASLLHPGKSRIITGVLNKETITGYPIFRLGGINCRCILASLDFIESAYRREVLGMKIREFIVQ